MFQSTYLYKVRPCRHVRSHSLFSFNPRTYIRYDLIPDPSFQAKFLFQSTYLYKVRQFCIFFSFFLIKFQSTYLYKVRLSSGFCRSTCLGFQSTYLYKVRQSFFHFIKHFFLSFNPRTYIRYDCRPYHGYPHYDGFNPRTYIRYDCITNNANIYSLLSMHLCDNKLFGFFIDEIKLIGVFNRLIINDCENSSFLLMLNVRKQLYYKFIFYIIGCDDTYVFNSFRIIISQEIETNTIFFMIDDIR